MQQIRTWTLAGSLLSGVGLSACGVKGPPVAPESKPEAAPLILNCSPYSEKCDERDPNYVPGLDPSKPQDAKRIQELEAAAAKRRQNR